VTPPTLLASPGADGVPFAPEAEEPVVPPEHSFPAPGDDTRPTTLEDSSSREASTIDIDGGLMQLPGIEKLTLGAHDPASVEQYRRLAARLLMAQAEKGTRLVMVTSAIAGEGKTLTSSNLALTLSESYKRSVLLIDGDFRRPTIHEVFNVPNVTGLNDGLRVPAERKIPLLSYTEKLTLLTAGRPDGDPMSVLSGEQMRRVLAEAAKRFEFVIIDTPPVALLPDAHVLANLVDGVLLVVESGRSPLPALKKAIDAVGRARVMGVVLNRATTDVHGGNYYYYSPPAPSEGHPARL
jgi:capsular exopolysaccharide synthesis family protein